jgi:hypothetical protein
MLTELYPLQYFFSIYFLLLLSIFYYIIKLIKIYYYQISIFFFSFQI